MFAEHHMLTLFTGLTYVFVPIGPVLFSARWVYKLCPLSRRRRMTTKRMGPGLKLAGDLCPPVSELKQKSAAEGSNA
jgi:hypothetical protein